MNNLSKYPLLRFLSGFSTFIWVVSIIGSTIVILALMYGIIFSNSEPFSMTGIKLPVKIDRLILPVESNNPDFVDAEVKIDSARIGFSNTNVYFKFMYLVVVIIGFSVYLFIIYQIKEMLFSLKKETPFTLDNVQRLKMIGYTFIGGDILSSTLLGFFNLVTNDTLFVNGVELSVGINSESYLIFSGMVIILIGEVFRVGVDLREESNLTI